MQKVISFKQQEMPLWSFHILASVPEQPDALPSQCQTYLLMQHQVMLLLVVLKLLLRNPKHRIPILKATFSKLFARPLVLHRHLA
jgi:hypothetical protein